MKKLLIVAISVVFISVMLSSCRSHERCAAYGKINKINSQKVYIDITQKSI
jgi:uncharacterized protein YcfL